MAITVPIPSRPHVEIILDEQVYDDLKKDKHLTQIGFFDKLLQHSNGYAFFQRYRSYKESPKYETIYLHKLIAERYIKKPATSKRLFVRFIDGNVRNVQLSNLEWVTMNTLRREMKGTSSTGFRGVTRDRGRYRVVIYHEDKKYDLGFFDNLMEAAKAYNAKSVEMFGLTKGLNDV